MSGSRCPLCGGQVAREVFRERGIPLMQCGDCELFYIWPYPQDADQTYETVRTYDYDDLEIIDAQRHYASSQLYYQRYFPLILPELASARSVLDVGCGTGHLLELIGRHAPHVRRVGIELNGPRAEFARQVADCPILQIPVEQLAADQTFDVIFLMNVLSHVPQLDPLFEAIKARLNPDGRIVLKVGEMASNVKKSATHDWGIPDHLHFLGLKTMEVLARKYDLQIARHERQPLADELFARQTWLAPGRSRLRNVVKRTVAATPGALAALSRLYRRVHGDSIFTSLVVLRRG